MTPFVKDLIMWVSLSDRYITRHELTKFGRRTIFATKKQNKPEKITGDHCCNGCSISLCICWFIYSKIGEIHSGSSPTSTEPALETLRKLNPGVGTMIYPGQVITVPSTGSGGGSTITVQMGDTLWKIASKYGTTVNSIKSLNGLTSDMIYPGQVLRVSSGGASPTDQSGHRSSGKARSRRSSGRTL